MVLEAPATVPTPAMPPPPIIRVDDLVKRYRKADRNAVVDAMKGHVLAEGQLMGKYGRY